MKCLETALVALLLLVNLIIAQPSWADPPKFIETLEYTEITNTLNELLQVKDSQTPPAGMTVQTVLQKIGDLRLQKYILETAQNWGTCRNQTGKTLAIYAHKPKEADSQENTLYFLEDGQVTDNDWVCDGVYLPSGSKVANLFLPETQQPEPAKPTQPQTKPEPSISSVTQPKPDNSTQLLKRETQNSYKYRYRDFDDLTWKPQAKEEPTPSSIAVSEPKKAQPVQQTKKLEPVQELGTPLALKIVSGTQLVATINPENAIEFNVPPTKIFKAGEGDWLIPNLTQADIDSKVPNAPIDD